MTTAAELLRQSPLARLEARILLAHALGWQRTELITRDTEPLNRHQVLTFAALEARRLAGEPVAQIIGTREFYGLEFKVTPAVLIPRPETELLVDAVLTALSSIPSPHLLELGTGSGAIAIAIAQTRPDAMVVATDCSHDALHVAVHNATSLLPAQRPGGALRFAAGDWYEALCDDLGTASLLFDAIVSNPPYIAANDPHLTQGDLRFEPIHALTDGSSGLDALRLIISGAPARLRAGGALWIEHGYDQASAVRKLMAAQGFHSVTSLRDLSGIERISGGTISG